MVRDLERIYIGYNVYQAFTRRLPGVYQAFTRRLPGVYRVYQEVNRKFTGNNESNWSETKMRNLKKAALILLIITPVVVGTQFYILVLPVTTFYQEPGKEYYYWGDSYGDPCSPYPLVISITSSNGVPVVVDPNTGTRGYLSNADPNYLANPLVPSNPQDHYFWGFTYKAPPAPSSTDISVRVAKEGSDQFFTQRTVRIQSLTKPTVVFGGCRSK